MKEQHIHKLKLHRHKSGNAIFFCALPDCTFKTNIALALGKRSLCWRCGETFVMTEYSLRLIKPHCDACHKSKSVSAKLDDILNLTERSEVESTIKPTIDEIEEL